MSSDAIDAIRLVLQSPSVSPHDASLPTLRINLQALLLAAHCLWNIGQWEDCVSLLQPIAFLEIDDESHTQAVGNSRALFRTSQPDEVNPIAGIYCVVGKCYDMMENRARAEKALSLALKIDIAVIEAAEYMTENFILTGQERESLMRALAREVEPKRKCMLDMCQEVLLNGSTDFGRGCQISSSSVGNFNTARSLVLKADWLLNAQNYQESYRLSRHAYTIDPYDERGLIVYIASMVSLKLKTELFYLGHELVQSSPKKQLSWYCVGCYYWCCSKHELAQKYLLKSTTIDKRFFRAWVLLGHVLSAQEESEQAIAAYRSASRLLPGDHKPMVYMAKELIRTNFLSLAAHMLLGAAELCPNDPGVLNELGVVYMRMQRVDLSLQHLESAVQALSRDLIGEEQQRQETPGRGAVWETIQYDHDRMHTPAPTDLLPNSTDLNSSSFKKSCGFEVYTT